MVERGTAKSIAGAFVAPGKGERADSVAGKTGTGDQRFQTYGPGGRLISSRSVNRSATFVFTLGERFFGTVTLNVSEPLCRATASPARWRCGCCATWRRRWRP
ncbi:hypothetical protein ACTMU2_26955 [Cupriavidus basilensis]